MTIRKVNNSKEDCDLIYSLSNDPLVRANSFSTKQIEYSSHCEWLQKSLSDNNKLFFLIFDNNDFVGQIRFVREIENSNECVISLSITEMFRGKHIDSNFLKLGLEEMHKVWDNMEYVIAEVKKKILLLINYL